MPRRTHNPKIIQQRNGWIVVCADCQLERSSIPIGINMPVKSRAIAQLLLENHAEHRGQPMRRGE